MRGAEQKPGYRYGRHAVIVLVFGAAAAWGLSEAMKSASVSPSREAFIWLISGTLVVISSVVTCAVGYFMPMASSQSTKAQGVGLSVVGLGVGVAVILDALAPLPLGMVLGATIGYMAGTLSWPYWRSRHQPTDSSTGSDGPAHLGS